MSGQPNKRRRTRAIGPDSVEFANALTHKTITTTNRSGETVMKNILVPLVPLKPIPTQNNTPGSSATNLPTTQDYQEIMDSPLLNDNDANLTGNTSNPSHQNKSKVSIYI